MTSPRGVDGSVELVAELDRQSDNNLAARNAPRSADLYRYISDGIQRSKDAEGFTDLALSLIQRLSIWWSPQAYVQLPTMVPWCVRDRSCRYDQGPEAWGAPRSDGYLRDDNSIIKKLPLPLQISGEPDSPYSGRKVWRGFTACHIWRDLPSGELAGGDPWLYSFMPNLVWVPSWLAPLTDRQGGEIQAVLQRTSVALFRSADVLEPLRKYADEAWGKLPGATGGSGRMLSPQRLSTFDPVTSFYTRRIRYLDKFVRGCDDVLAGRRISQKLICSRYTDALPGVARNELELFRATMDGYRRACLNALSAQSG